MSETKSTAEKICSNIRTFFELDSRGIGQMSTAKTDTDVKVRYIEIPTPAWFPDSLLRSMKRNNYMSMINNAASKETATTVAGANDGSSLDFYQEDNSDMVSGLVKNVVKSVVSYTANQIVSITSKVDSLVSGLNSLASSFTKSGEKSATETNMNSYPFLAHQPYVTIYGIHLTESLRDNILTIQSAMEGISSAVTEEVYGSLSSEKNKTSWLAKCAVAFAGIKDKLDKSAKNALIKFIAPSVENGSIKDMITQLAFDEKTRLHGMAETMLNCIVSGTYTMKCKIPYIHSNSQVVIQSSGNHGFHTQGDMQMGEDTSIGKFIKDQTGLNVVWTNPLDWKCSSLNSNRISPLTLNFDIFNDTLEHTMLNLAFIWLFGATSKSVTDSFFVRPPFLYDIQIPTGFRFKYCACNFKVEPRGRTRKLGNVTNNGNSPLVNLFKNTYGIEINPSAVEFVPDYYNVQMTFTSLLPDLWNFMDSYLFYKNTDSEEENKAILGKRLSTKMQTFIEGMNKATTQSGGK